MNSQSAFDFANSHTRNTDPVSSYDSAKEHFNSGAHECQKQRVLEALTQFPNSTSHELAHKSGLDRYMIARRLPDLEHNELVKKSGTRKCSISSRQVTVWDLV